MFADDDQTLEFQWQTFVESGYKGDEIYGLVKALVDPLIAAGTGVIAASLAVILSDLNVAHLYFVIALLGAAMGIACLKAGQVDYLTAFMHLRLNRREYENSGVGSGALLRERPEYKRARRWFFAGVVLIISAAGNWAGMMVVSFFYIGGPVF